MNIVKALQLALKYHQEGNLHQAKHTCEEILKVQPDNDIASFLLGIMHFQLCNYDYSITFLKKTIQFDPSNVHAYSMLGVSFEQKGSFDEAMNFYQKALQLDSKLDEINERSKKLFILQAIRKFLKKENPIILEIGSHNAPDKLVA